MKHYLYAMGAILCWASLPAATGNSLKSLSTEELMFMSFSSAAVFLYLQNLIKNRTLKIYIPPLKVCIFGVWGIFLYHYVYYKAIENAPIAECAVLATTWSFWIVVFSSIIKHRKIKGTTILTALTGMFGAALVILSAKGFSFETEYIFGYSMAVLCGLIWSSFSVGLPIVNKDGEDPMILFTIVTAIISAIIYGFYGKFSFPEAEPLFSAVYLGFVPLGLSFFLWNRALPGNLTIIGYLSYLTPPLAVLFVAVINRQEISIQVIAGMLVIIAASVTGNYFDKKIN